MKTLPNIILFILVLGNTTVYPQDPWGIREMNPFHQLRQKSYLEVMKSNISDGIAFRYASVTSIKVKDNKLETGFSLPCTGQQETGLDGLFLNFGRSFRIKKVPLEITLFYRDHPVSDNIHEINWGVMMGYSGSHFIFSVGNNSRLFLFLDRGIGKNKTEGSGSSYFIEPRNFMYSFRYLVMPAWHRWNASLTISNFDYFLIEYETNPMAGIDLSYRLNGGIDLYCEFWYQRSGLTNLQSNFFGYTLRAGAIWRIDW